MKWYYKLVGAHVRVRVFMNVASCGVLTFRPEEFADLRVHFRKDIEFIHDKLESDVG